MQKIINFNEFQTLINQIVYVSATPADFELEQSQGVVVEQVVRPTGLLDPPIEVRPSINQIDDLSHHLCQLFTYSTYPVCQYSCCQLETIKYYVKIFHN